MNKWLLAVLSLIVSALQAWDSNALNAEASIQVLINGGLSGTNGCWLYIVNSSGQVWLRDDSNTSWIGPVTMGSTGTLTNSQCTLRALNSYALYSGNDLYVNVELTFKASFAGLKTHFLYGVDATGGNTGWRALGTYSVLSATPPLAQFVSPSTGLGTTAPWFQYSFYDANGAADIVSTQILIGSTLSPANACYAYIVGNRLYLAADSGTAWSSPLVLGSPGILQNSQCIIDGGWVASSENNFDVVLRITFKPAFAGTKSNFMFAADSTGLSSGWQSRGTWTVP